MASHSLPFDEQAAARDRAYDTASVPVPARTVPQGRDWLAEAREAYGDGDGHRAIYAAREAIALDGSNADAWMIRARSSAALGRVEDAEFEARETVRLAPHVAESHALLAGALQLRGRYDEALREIDDALRLDPLHSLYRGLRGSIHLSAGRTDEAVAIFEELHAEDPDDPDARRALADALYEQAERGVTQLPGDRHSVTSLEQIALVRTNTSRALALDVDDPDGRDALRALRAQADAAEAKQWSRSNNLGKYVLGILGSLIIGIGSLGSGTSAGILIGAALIILGVGLTWLFVSRHYRPQWQYNALAALEEIRRG